MDEYTTKQDVPNWVVWVSVGIVVVAAWGCFFIGAFRFWEYLHK